MNSAIWFINSAFCAIKCTITSLSAFGVVTIGSKVKGNQARWRKADAGLQLLRRFWCFIVHGVTVLSGYQHLFGFYEVVVDVQRIPVSATSQGRGI